MADRPTPEQQMPVHVEAAYKDAVENIIFLKRQQWVATNYAVLVYAAIFVISGAYFSRTEPRLHRDRLWRRIGTSLGDQPDAQLDPLRAATMVGRMLIADV